MLQILKAASVGGVPCVCAASRPRCLRTGARTLFVTAASSAVCRTASLQPRVSNSDPPASSDQNPLPSHRDSRARREGMESGGVGMGGGECRSNDYGDAAYWDARYSSSGSRASGGGEFFDWYQTYAALRPLLRARIPAASRVLMVGCGNSRTSATLSPFCCALLRFALL